MGITKMLTVPVPVTRSAIPDSAATERLVERVLLVDHLLRTLLAGPLELAHVRAMFADRQPALERLIAGVSLQGCLTSRVSCMRDACGFADCVAARVQRSCAVHSACSTSCSRTSRRA